MLFGKRCERLDRIDDVADLPALGDGLKLVHGFTG
jgi:hypothetical protein